MPVVFRVNFGAYLIPAGILYWEKLSQWADSSIVLASNMLLTKRF